MKRYSSLLNVQDVFSHLGLEFPNLLLPLSGYGQIMDNYPANSNQEPSDNLTFPTRFSYLTQVRYRVRCNRQFLRSSFRLLTSVEVDS